MAARPPVKKRTRYTPAEHHHLPEDDGFERDELPDDDSDGDWRNDTGHPDRDRLAHGSLYLEGGDEDDDDEGEDEGEDDDVCGDAAGNPNGSNAQGDISIPGHPDSARVARGAHVSHGQTDPYVMHSGMTHSGITSGVDFMTSEGVGGSHGAVVDARQMHTGAAGANAVGGASAFANALPPGLAESYAAGVVDGDRHVLGTSGHGQIPSLFHDVALQGPIDADGTAPFHEFERDEIETSSDEDDAQSIGNDFDDEDDEFEEDDEEEDTDSRTGVAAPDGDARRIDEGDVTGSAAGERQGLEARESLNQDTRLASRRDSPSPDGNDAGEDYAHFLQAILADDVPSTSPLPSGESLFLDDDDGDFDYLTAVAQTKEDPLEYRNDKAVHVSRREIVDLVAGQPSRRRRTRRLAHSGVHSPGQLKATHSPRQPPAAPLAPAPVQVLAPLRAAPQTLAPAPGVIHASTLPVQHNPWAPPTAPEVPPAAVNGTASPGTDALTSGSGLGFHPQFQSLFAQHMALQSGIPLNLAAPVLPAVAPGPSSFGSTGGLQHHASVPLSGATLPIPTQLPGWATFGQISAPSCVPSAPAYPTAPTLVPRPTVLPEHGQYFWPNMIGLLQHQLSSLVVLLAHVHAKSEPGEAREKSGTLLKDLIDMRDLSRKYKATFEPARLEREDPMYAGSEHQPEPETYLATPALDIVDRFLDDVAAGKESASTLLLRFKEYADENLLAALAIPPVRQKLSLSSEAEAVDWTVEDDQLLAMTIAKHTIDFGDSSKDLLPHREPADCQRRMRYLSSRRCRDNPVKRQVHAMTANVQPLSRMEIDIIKQGLARYGAGDASTTDHERPGPEVWKAIQRDMLPHRDWRQLDKVWGWREAKRRYKLNSRLKKKA